MVLSSVVCRAALWCGSHAGGATYKNPKGATTPGRVLANSGPPGVPGRPLSVVVACIVIEDPARCAADPAKEDERIEAVESMVIEAVAKDFS